VFYRLAKLRVNKNHLFSRFFFVNGNVDVIISPSATEMLATN
jgi:hypothetical protein